LCRAIPENTLAIQAGRLCRRLAVLVLLLLPAWAGVQAGECGQPDFTGQMYVTKTFSSSIAGVSNSYQDYSPEYLQYLSSTLRNWCVDHHGSWVNGGCSTGPNWVCNLNGGGSNAGSRTLPVPVPRISTSQMMKQEVLNSATQQILVPVLSGLFSNLFNFDSGADDAQNAQLQQQYLQQQAQLAAQRKAAEEAHKQQMLNDLSGTMKLSGGSDLQLKTTDNDAGGLRLKLIGGINDGDHAGNPSLPGIALNGGNVPYGVPGLPGIYTNGPSTAPVMQESGMQLKLGDSNTVSNPTPPAPPATDSTAQVGGLQLKLGDSGSSAPAAQTTGSSSQTPAQQAGPSLVPAPSSTTADAANGGSNSAQTQAQQIQANSQAATNATSMEGAKALAGQGWDGGSVNGKAVALPVPLPSANATVMVPVQPKNFQPASPVPPPALVASMDRPVPILNTVIANQAPGKPLFKPEISAAVQAMSNEQLRAKYCQVQEMEKQLHAGFLKEAGAFDGWQKNVGEAKRAEYEESRQCFFDNLAESMADAAGEKLVDFGDWILNGMLKKGWEGAEEFKKNVELLTTMKSTAEDVNESLDKFQKSEKSAYDRRMLSISLINDFYSIASKMPGVGGGKNKDDKGVDYGQITGLGICMANYMVTIAEQRLLNEELSQANKSVEDQLRAESALSKFSGEMVSAQLIRGMHPAEACK
jgi:hypothetical protein